MVFKYPWNPEMFYLHASVHATAEEAAYFANLGFWTGAISGLLVGMLGTTALVLWIQTVQGGETKS